MLISIVLTSVILILNDSIHFISIYFTKTKFLHLWISFLTAPFDLMIVNFKLYVTGGSTSERATVWKETYPSRYELH